MMIKTQKQKFETSITVNGDGTAELFNKMDGDKEIIVPVMAIAFVEGLKARNPVVMEGFEILQSVCLSVIENMPELKAHTTPKRFGGRDLFKK